MLRGRPRRSAQRRSLEHERKIWCGLKEGSIAPGELSPLFDFFAFPSDEHHRRCFATGPGAETGMFNPKGTKERVFVAESPASGSNQCFQSWQIPRNASMVMLIAGGSGAGGGAGLQAATGTAKGGGAGGGSGGTARLFIPRRFLPSTIYFNVAQGGLGGVSSGGTGSNGSFTHALTAAELTFRAEFILRSGGLNASQGGTGGAASGAAAGGVGEVVSDVTMTPYTSLGIFSANGGATGANGGNAVGPIPGQPASYGVLTGLFCTAGAGGGAASAGNAVTAGGSVSASGGNLLIPPTLAGGAGVAGGPGGAGSQGVFWTDWFFIAYGGAGGGASATANAGGVGGSTQGWCAGGGGGGAGVVFGAGGQGGPGFAYVAWW